MTAASVTIGLVGCGHWGKNILRDLKILKCTVWTVAIDETSYTNAQEQGSDHLVARVEDLPDFLDGYVVATPDSTHAAVIESLLPRRRPIFVEKPLTTDPNSARRLATVGAGQIFVMDKWRYHAGIEALAALAQNQTLGKPVALHTVRQQWQHYRAEADEVWHLATHDLSIILHVLGTHGCPVAAVPEWGQGRLMGLCGYMEVAGIPATIMVSCRHLEFRRTVVLQCTQGVATLHDAYADHILVARDTLDAKPQPYPIHNELPLLKELRAFVHYLQGGPPPLSSVADAAQSVEILAQLRALASARFPLPVMEK